MKPKIILQVTLIFLTLLIISSALQGQENFQIGVWNFTESYDDNVPIAYDDTTGQYYVLDNETGELKYIGCLKDTNSGRKIEVLTKVVRCQAAKRSIL